MPTWALRTLRAWLSLSAVALLATLAHGAEQEPPAVKLHPLVEAAEALYKKGLPQACGELIMQASMSRGLTNEDRVRLRFLNAVRAFDEGEPQAARMVLSQVLQASPSAAPPPYASKLDGLVKEVRTSLTGAPSEDRSSQLAADIKAASEREPEHVVLLRAVDSLYADSQFDGARVVLAMVPTSEAPARAQVAVGRGIIRMQEGDEAGARAAFYEALLVDRSTVLPTHAPPEVIPVFEEIKLASEAARGQFLGGPRGQGVAVAGAGLALIAGGAVAGVIALNSYHMEQDAQENLKYDAYTQSRDTSKLAINVADGLYVAGALALGVGTYLFFSIPGKASVGAGVGPGRASVVVGGRF